jgi:hypothetical protein
VKTNLWDVGSGRLWRAVLPGHGQKHVSQLLNLRWRKKKLNKLNENRRVFLPTTLHRTHPAKTEVSFLHLFVFAGRVLREVICKRDQKKHWCYESKFSHLSQDYTAAVHQGQTSQEVFAQRDHRFLCNNCLRDRIHSRFHTAAALQQPL